MALKASDRLAEVQGQTVKVMQKARINARVISVDLATGQEIGESFKVGSDKLENLRCYQATAEMPRTVYVPNRVHEQLSRLARPSETHAEVIQRLIQRHAAQMQRETGA